MPYILDEKMNQEYVDKYIAIAYKVLNPDSDSPPEFDPQERPRWLRQSNQGPHEEIKLIEGVQFLPIVQMTNPKNIQRSVFVIFGMGGSGKSVLTNSICQTYNALNPKKNIYFITNNNYKIDSALDHDIYKFINADDFFDNFLENPDELKSFKTETSNFDDSLIVFDDIDFEENIKKKKIFFNFVDILLKFKRKNSINIIYTTHDVTDYKYTRGLCREMTDYIFFGFDLRNRSNRILETYLKLSTKEIHRLTSNKKSRWIMVNAVKRFALATNEIYSFQ